jgi:hypothetical protein
MVGIAEFLPMRTVVLLFALAFFAFVAEGISGEAENAADDDGALMLLRPDIGDIAEPYILNTSLGLDKIDQLRAVQDNLSKNDVFAPLQSDPWAAIAVSGKVLQHWGNGELASAVIPGTYLPGGVQIETGPGTWIILSRQKNLVTVKENSTVKLLPLEDDGKRTQIFQFRGGVYYEVDKRRDEHFTVETPYLAAVVKGTAFGVGVANGVASVSVSQGQVSVSVTSGGSSVSISAGQTASVSANAASVSVSVTGTGEAGNGNGGGNAGGNGGGNGGG